MTKNGRMCITTCRDSTEGTTGIWVGYADGNPIGTYQVFNPKRKKYFDPRCDFSMEVIQWVQQGWKMYLVDYKCYEGLDDE